MNNSPASKPPPCKRPSFPHDHVDTLFSTSNPNIFNSISSPYNSNINNFVNYPIEKKYFSQFNNLSACLVDPNIELPNLTSNDLESIFGKNSASPDTPDQLCLNDQILDGQQLYSISDTSNSAANQLNSSQIYSSNFSQSVTTSSGCCEGESPDLMMDRILDSLNDGCYTNFSSYSDWLSNCSRKQDSNQLFDRPRINSTQQLNCNNNQARDYLGLITSHTTERNSSNLTFPSSNRNVGALLLHNSAVSAPPVRVVYGSGPPRPIGNNCQQFAIRQQINSANNAGIASNNNLSNYFERNSHKSLLFNSTSIPNRPKSEADYRESILHLFPSCRSVDELELEEEETNSPILFSMTKKTSSCDNSADIEEDSMSRLTPVDYEVPSIIAPINEATLTPISIAPDYNFLSAQPKESSSIRQLFSQIPIAPKLENCSRKIRPSRTFSRAERGPLYHQILKCSHCHKSFNTHSRLHAHMHQHLPLAEREPRLCQFSNCGKRFFNLDRYHKHLINFHGMNKNASLALIHNTPAEGDLSHTSKTTGNDAGVLIPFTVSSPSLTDTVYMQSKSHQKSSITVSQPITINSQTITTITSRNSLSKCIRSDLGHVSGGGTILQIIPLQVTNHQLQFHSLQPLKGQSLTTIYSDQKLNTNSVSEFLDNRLQTSENNSALRSPNLISSSHQKPSNTIRTQSLVGSHCREQSLAPSTLNTGNQQQLSNSTELLFLNSRNNFPEHGRCATISGVPANSLVITSNFCKENAFSMNSINLNDKNNNISSTTTATTVITTCTSSTTTTILTSSNNQNNSGPNIRCNFNKELNEGINSSKESKTAIYRRLSQPLSCKEPGVNFDDLSSVFSQPLEASTNYTSSQGLPVSMATATNKSICCKFCGLGPFSSWEEMQVHLLVHDSSDSIDNPQNISQIIEFHQKSTNNHYSAINNHGNIDNFNYNINNNNNNNSNNCNNTNSRLFGCSNTNKLQINTNDNRGYCNLDNVGYCCPVDGCLSKCLQRLDLATHLQCHFPPGRQVLVYCCPTDGCDLVFNSVESFRKHFASNHTSSDLSNNYSIILAGNQTNELIPNPTNIDKQLESVNSTHLMNQHNAVNCSSNWSYGCNTDFCSVDSFHLPELNDDMELIQDGSRLFEALDLIPDFFFENEDDSQSFSSQPNTTYSELVLAKTAQLSSNNSSTVVHELSQCVGKVDTHQKPNPDCPQPVGIKIASQCSKSAGSTSRSNARIALQATKEPKVLSNCNERRFLAEFHNLSPHPTDKLAHTPVSASREWPITHLETNHRFLTPGQLTDILNVNHEPISMRGFNWDPFDRLAPTSLLHIDTSDTMSVSSPPR